MLMAAQLQAKKTFTSKQKEASPAIVTSESDILKKIALESDRARYWCEVFLIYPLLPFCKAISTITVGGVILNAASNACNTKLQLFMQGAVVLSHIFVIFFAYAWTGPRPIQSLRTLWVFYIVYGAVCCAWWGVFGTLQIAGATVTGFQACFLTSPTLYLMSQYEVIVFWTISSMVVIYFIQEKALENGRKIKARKEEMREKELEEARAWKLAHEGDRVLYKRNDSEDEDEEEEEEIVEFDRDADLQLLDAYDTPL